MALLDLNTSPRTAVLRQIETILKTNATLKRVVKTWRTWREKPGQNPPFGIEHAPAVRITPSNGPEDWRYPTSFVGPLYLNIEYLLIGADADDPLNFWWALELALYPGGAGTLANIQALQQAGANDGLVVFSQPGMDPGPDGTFWNCIGQMRIDVRLDLPT